MMIENLHIQNNNISAAWAEAFVAAIEPGVEEICHLTITINGFQAGQYMESREIRNALDRTLIAANKFATESTANTIFPNSYWNRQKAAEYLYERYLRILPRIKRANYHNKYGLYFERLIDYGSNHHNQLSQLIQNYKAGNHRRSALQVAVYNPLVDQTNQRQRGFPCLQQIAFIPSSSSDELTIHGFYATQYLFERAYGNLLGLARLGTFVASQLGLRFSKVVCTTAVAKYSGHMNRGELITLATGLKDLLRE